MRRVVTVGPRRAEVQEDLEPVAAPGQVIVGVEMVGLCGSDLHFYLGDYPYVNYPRTQGHEFVGLVESLGEGVSGLSVGQRVAVEPIIPCGTCFPCRRGHRNCCTRMQTIGVQVDGGLCERIALPAANLHATGDLPADIAVLSEPLSIAEHAVRRAAPRAGDQVVVFGAGPVGLAILVVAAQQGARVLVVDPLPARLALATSFGAEVVAEAGDHAAVDAAISAWTDGDGPACVFEAAGSPAVLEQAVGVVAASGTIVVVGLSVQPAAIPLIAFTRKELNVLGSRNNLGVFGDAIETVRRHAPAIGALVTHRFPLDHAADALELLAEHPEATEKVVVTIARSA
jgi:threonine dehydrogenase-like Zn-dependent dehydrogenase